VVAPLVSVVMPTRNRRLFAQKGIGYFERSRIHEHGGAELIIVDGGKSVLTDDECRGHRHLIVPAETTIGTRCNLGFAEARGRIFARQDDDDFYGPGWLSLVAARLPSTKSGVTGSVCHYVYDVFTRRGWPCVPTAPAQFAIGGSSCFWREVWEHGPFPDKSGGEDVEFAIRAGATFGAGGDGCEGSEDHFVYIRHGQNCTGGQAFAIIDPPGTTAARAVLGSDLLWYEEIAELAGGLFDRPLGHDWHVPESVRAARVGARRG
jgi:glycosyltransferase involved in cell wall biosynthesis